MTIKKDAIEQSLDHIRRCLHIIDIAGRKDVKIIITPNSIDFEYILDYEHVVLSGAKNVTEYLHTTLEA
ncbi:hypothetical protein LCGC14_2556380 [marine sediment metagenome]|uniref:Uncharacterized protein n=1 Tax=marine sediment metagenome TaxID=412755 RepID=A0A0F9ALX4_9ZZZZ